MRWRTNGAEGYITQTTLDIEGKPLLITDARDNEAMQHRFGLGGQLLYQKSNDSGERWMLAGATGQRLRAWNGRGFVYRSSYDGLRRPTHEQVQLGSGSERLARALRPREAHPQATALNLRGRAPGGMMARGSCDEPGVRLQGQRCCRRRAGCAARWHADADWSVLSALTDGGCHRDGG